MALAEDVARWTWHKGRFEEIPPMRGDPAPVKMLYWPQSSLKAEFDMLYEESRSTPRILHWAMHPKITGRPYPAWVLDQLLAYVAAHQGVWIAAANEVASLA